MGWQLYSFFRHSAEIAKEVQKEKGQLQKYGDIIDVQREAMLVNAEIRNIRRTQSGSAAF